MNRPKNGEPESVLAGHKAGTRWGDAYSTGRQKTVKLHELHRWL